MSDTEASVKFIADPTGVIEGMRAAAEAVEGGSTQMKTALAGLNAAFESAMAPLIAFMAILKGGEFLGEAVSATVDMNKEAAKLGKQLGISANEAGALSMAIEKVHGTTDAFSQASSMLTRQIKNNEDGVKAMGLETRNSDGSLRNMKDIMMDAIGVLNGYKAGTDRNLAAQVLFGRGAQNLGPILKLNNDLLEEAKKRQEELGLTITKEGQERVQKYRDAMTEAGEVMEAIKVAIGNAVMPALTMLGEWFSGVGPTVIAVFKDAMDILGAVIGFVADTITTLWGIFSDVFSQIGAMVTDLVGGKATTDFLTWGNAIKVVEIAFLALRTAITVAVEVIATSLTYLIGFADAAMMAINSALRGDFPGAQAAWDQGMANIEARVEQAKARVTGEMAQIQASYEKIMQGPKSETPANDPPSKKGKSYVAPPDKSGDDDRMKGWELKLAQQKLALAQENEANHTAHEMSKAEEAAYWAEILQMGDLTAKERIAVETKRVTASLAAQSAEESAKLEGMKKELDAAKNNGNERIRIAQQIATETANYYGKGTQQAIAAEAEVVKVKQEAAAQILKIGDALLAGQRQRDLANIDQEAAMADREVQLGQITNAQKLALDRQFEDQRFAIQRKALEDQKAALVGSPSYDPVAVAKIQNQIEALDQQHQSKLTQIDTQAILQRNKLETDAAKSISQSWGQALSQLATGQASFASTVRSMWQGIVGAVASALEQMIANWLEQQILAFLGIKAAKAVSAIGQITSYAGVAAAGAVAATAAIPVVGPGLAPAAGTAAFSEAMAYAPTASARDGFDVPKGMNPITQLHAEEMVLPAEHANALRDLVNGGGLGGQGGPQIHIHAMDAQSFRGFLNSGGGREIMKHLNEASRNFRRP